MASPPDYLAKLDLAAVNDAAGAGELCDEAWY
jgi:hypothetical protein